MLTSDEPLQNLLFGYRGADLILRSHDSHHFRVPKSYIVNSSPVLDELIQRALDAPSDVHSETSLPVVQLPESGVILHSLLTFIFPVTPLVPSTTENAMELLFVAQKYQMVSVLAHIRLCITQQNPPPTQLDPALHMYSLARKYGLHQEAHQAAQTISKYPMDIVDIEDKLDMMPGTALYELWKYYENVRASLASDLKEFRTSGARGILTGLPCAASGSSQIPRWLNDYIESIGDAPNLFDFFGFNTALARHMRDKAYQNTCTCSSISSQIIHNIWEALASVVHGSFEKVSVMDVGEQPTRLMSLQAESALSPEQGKEGFQAQVNLPTSLPEPLDISVPDANLIIRSSDLVDFRVHKSILAMVSPFFKDLFSVPQLLDSESLDGLPLIKLSEDAELLNTLLSMIFPVRVVIPDSYEKVLDLLVACQKYDMVQVQSSIRTEVNRGCFPAPVGTEAFHAYAIACSKGLTPETENAARQTLDYPMTFETLGKWLRSFDGCALRNLARFRKRCREKLVTCLKSFHEAQGTGIWFGCPDTMTSPSYGCPSRQSRPAVLPSWLRQVLSLNNHSKKQVFVDPLPTPSNIRAEYLKALLGHASCNFCLQVHAKNGPTFCTELGNTLALALNKVHTSSFDPKVSENLPLSHCRYAVTRGLPQIQLTQVLGTHDISSVLSNVLSNVTYDAAFEIISDIDLDAAFDIISDIDLDSAFAVASDAASDQETQER